MTLISCAHGHLARSCEICELIIERNAALSRAEDIIKKEKETERLLYREIETVYERDKEIVILRSRAEEAKKRVKKVEDWNNNAARLRDEAERQLCAAEQHVKILNKLVEEIGGKLCAAREAWEVLCRETLGAIIDATTLVQVEKLSGNIVKEAHVKGELYSLRLLESWLDRHAPEKMAELRRRAKEG